MVRTKKTEEDEVEGQTVTGVENDGVGKENAVPAGGISAVVFSLNDVVTRTRTFDAATHGENFLAIADEFARSNARKIKSREDVKA